MKHIKAWLRGISAPRSACPNGHQSVYQDMDGTWHCMDCGAEWR